MPHLNELYGQTVGKKRGGSGEETKIKKNYREFKINFLMWNPRDVEKTKIRNSRNMTIFVKERVDKTMK